LAIQVDPDVRIFAYTFLISLFAGILFGLAPALQTSKPNLTSILKDEGTGFAGPLRKSHLRNFLVATQVAVSMVLLICAGLLVKGSSRALTLNPGFETKRILGMSLELPPGLEYSQARKGALIQQLAQRLRPLPGVVSVSRGRVPFAGGMRTTSVALDGHKLMSNGRAVEMYYSYVSADYFGGLSIPILVGRTFSDEDARVGAPVALVSEATARQLGPGQDPLGKQITLDATEEFHDELFPASRMCRVIGVTKDVRSL